MPENVAPPYYDPAFSNLTDPCASFQEDLPFDVDSVGLDNDGDGAADYPADSDCAAPAATPTATPTPLGLTCGTAPAMGCIAPEKGSLSVDEKTAGKEKLKVKLTKLQSTVTQSQFGDPVAGSTAYAICIYDSADQLKGTYTIDRAGDTCDGKPCWAAISDKGYKYGDKNGSADGIVKMKVSGGPAGKGKVKVIGKNATGQLPLGVAALLQCQTSATVQVLTSDARASRQPHASEEADGTVFCRRAPRDAAPAMTDRGERVFVSWIPRQCRRNSAAFAEKSSRSVPAESARSSARTTRLPPMAVGFSFRIEGFFWPLHVHPEVQMVEHAHGLMA
jgi:hypothetical protein